MDGLHFTRCLRNVRPVRASFRGVTTDGSPFGRRGHTRSDTASSGYGVLVCMERRLGLSSPHGHFIDGAMFIITCAILRRVILCNRPIMEGLLDHSI